MPRAEGQKAKLLVLKQIFERKTDEEHMLSVPQLLDALTTVRYPRARMRRLAMDAALGYTVETVPALPPYLHLLGARRKALPLLKHASLPLSHSLAKLEKENDACARMAAAHPAISSVVSARALFVERAARKAAFCVGVVSPLIISFITA